MLNKEDIDYLYNVLLDAGAAVLQLTKQGFALHDKSDGSVLTTADLASDDIITKALSFRFPDIAVFSEERYSLQKSFPVPDIYFLVDPLDGTREFSSGSADYTIQIGLLVKGTPYAGIILAPAHQQCFVGCHGMGSFRIYNNGLWGRLTCQSDKVSTVSILLSHSHENTEAKKWINQIQFDGFTVIPKGMGSSLKLCRIASGEADIVLRPGAIHDWDTAAGHAIVRHAGGFVLDSETGQELRYGRTGFIQSGYISCGPSWRSYFSK